MENVFATQDGSETTADLNNVKRIVMVMVYVSKESAIVYFHTQGPLVRT